MIRAASIEGRVSDMSGNPAINVLVRAQLIGGNAATPVIAQQTRTDDSGRYRLHTLNAGEYVIDVTGGDPRVAQAGAAGPTGRPELARTYYPGTARVEEAQRVVALAGLDVRSIDVILVTAAPAPTLPVGAAPSTSPTTITDARSVWAAPRTPATHATRHVSTHARGGRPEEGRGFKSRAGMRGI